MSIITRIMKQQYLLIICLFQLITVIAQTSLQQIDLSYGKHEVGFSHFTATDSTRTYQRIYDYDQRILSRQIPVSIWYPAEGITSNKLPMKVLDYFEILKEEEEWEYLPNEQLLNWFYYQNTEANQKHLKESTSAYSNIPMKKDKYPVILYAPSYQASSIENFALCEYLASHGYIVISSPSRGAATRWFVKNNEQNMETQARDVEFLMTEASKISSVDFDRMAVLGFSFGGLSNLLVQMRNKRIKAVVSLDGTERYLPEIVEKSPFYDSLKINVPYLHMAQKQIPDQVLREDGIDEALNTKFDLYDRMIYSNRYKLKFHHLTHAYFSSLGVLFEKRDSRQDRSDEEIMESYKWVCDYTLNFMGAFLKKDKDALEFIESETEKNGLGPDKLSMEIRMASQKKYVFSDFNELAKLKNYDKLEALYQAIKKENTLIELPESSLNTLGLQLLFNPKTSTAGIRVLIFATSIYPNSANLYDSLAEAYLFIGNNEKAIENFEKSLALNAQNTNAIDRLKQLRK